MKVNGVDARGYGGKQLKVDHQPPKKIAGYEWVEGAAVPRNIETDITASTLTVEMKFSGETRDQVRRNISAFLALFKNTAEVTLDGYKGKFKGYLTGNSTMKTNRKDVYRETIELEGYFLDEAITETIEQTEKVIYVEGTRKTPCEIVAKAITDLSNYKITGKTWEITLEDIKAGESIVINSVEGTATINGENAFNKVNMWVFPILNAGENKITITSEEDATVTITYNPMWI